MLVTSDIREDFKRKLEIGEFVTDKTGVKTIEILGASFIADENSIFGTPNQDYINREIEWYNSMSLNVLDIPGDTPAIWRQVSDKYGYINSNYGWCIYSPNNEYQYQNCYDAIMENPDTRRAIMIYTRPSMQKDYNKNGMSDFMCTNTVQYLVRNNRLNAVVNMRSNDAVFGYKNDWAWQKYVLENLAEDTEYEVGNIHWQVGSIHVYEKHFHLVK